MDLNRNIQCTTCWTNLNSEYTITGKSKGPSDYSGNTDRPFVAKEGMKQWGFIGECSNFTKVLKEGGKQQIWFSEDIFLDSKIYSWVINLPW